MEQRPQRGAAYWLAPHGLLSLIVMHASTTCAVVMIPTMLWVLAHQSLIKKMPNRLTHRPVLWRQFLRCGCRFSDDCNLYHVDIKH